MGLWDFVNSQDTDRAGEGYPATWLRVLCSFLCCFYWLSERLFLYGIIKFDRVNKSCTPDMHLWIGPLLTNWISALQDWTNASNIDKIKDPSGQSYGSTDPKLIPRPPPKMVFLSEEQKKQLRPAEVFLTRASGGCSETCIKSRVKWKCGVITVFTHKQYPFYFCMIYIIHNIHIHAVVHCMFGACALW